VLWTARGCILQLCSGKRNPGSIVSGDNNSDHHNISSLSSDLPNAALLSAIQNCGVFPYCLFAALPMPLHSQESTPGSASCSAYSMARVDPGDFRVIAYGVFEYKQR
jgi:hypothetical protein